SAINLFCSLKDFAQLANFHFAGVPLDPYSRCVTIALRQPLNAVRLVRRKRNVPAKPLTNFVAKRIEPALDRWITIIGDFLTCCRGDGGLAWNVAVEEMGIRTPSLRYLAVRECFLVSLPPL